MSDHPAIFHLYTGSDGERSMTYLGAKIQCPRCDGWEGLVCPRDGCGVEIVSNQAERNERYRREMDEQEQERRRWRTELKARREERLS